MYFILIEINFEHIFLDYLLYRFVFISLCVYTHMFILWFIASTVLTLEVGDWFLRVCFVIRFFIWCCFINNPCHWSIAAMYAFSLRFFFFCIFFQNPTFFQFYITLILYTSSFGRSVSLVSALWHFPCEPALIVSAPALFEMKGKDMHQR